MLEDLSVPEQPEHVWLLPMSAAAVSFRLLEVHAEVEDHHRVGECPDREEVDTGRRDLTRPVEGEAAGGLEAWRGPR